MSNYVDGMIKKYKHPIGIDATTKAFIFDPIEAEIRKWANHNSLSIVEVILSGSRAKGTAIKLSSDMDIFISLSSSNTSSLETIFNSLFDYFNVPGLSCRKQNVSVGVTYNGHNIDLVPGRRQNQYGNDHSLYKSRQNTWTQTNINEHIRIVKNSNRIEEIVATKIWKHRHNLEFPSIFLELTALEGLKHRGTLDHDSNFLFLLEYIRDNIQALKIIDPANTNNIISNDLTLSEKRAISDQAKISRNKQNWTDIIW